MRNQLSIPVTALALLALAACGTESGSGSGDGGDGGGSVTTDLPVTGVHWSVDSVTVDGRKSAAPAGANVEITTKGRAQGNYGCNHFGADVDVKGDTITVGPGEMTEMGCAKKIQGFEDALRAAFSGKLKARLTDGKLTLTTEKGDAIALTAERPSPLVGTKWSVNSLLSDETATSLPAGTEKKAHLTFGKDGAVRGNLGCNNFTSTAKVSGSSVTFGRIASTRKLCPGPEMDLEREVLKVLKGTVTYELQHRGLSLTAANGKGLAAMAAPAAK
ncbi:META domain-containing protein [Streptomyces sp. NBC_01142]|uniref:META domain-containing protein n=1 Tax=Streptomyces sp. NBC_01142 TaxID=2975865 RepID=UPI00224D9153|nr:META domain-containing protein [Streptomyces sp. NBC_01142]MCX4824147.1 META domain-containing protein [Streptomyces sp. NBC_01142]